MVNYINMTTKEETNKKLRDYRLRTNNAATKKYEKTKRGFLVRCYRNMKSRVSGVQKEKFNLYQGKSLLDKETFYEWSLNNNDFNLLFLYWEIYGYKRKLTPSVDRVDSSLGYELCNMEWVTHSENIRRGSVSRWKNKN